MSEWPMSPLWMLVALAAGWWPPWLVAFWLMKRSMDRTARQWAAERREWRRQHREELARMTREVRRRLQLPEDVGDEGLT